MPTFTKSTCSKSTVSPSKNGVAATIESISSTSTNSLSIRTPIKLSMIKNPLSFPDLPSSKSPKIASPKIIKTLKTSPKPSWFAAPMHISVSNKSKKKSSWPVQAFKLVHFTTILRLLILFQTVSAQIIGVVAIRATATVLSNWFDDRGTVQGQPLLPRHLWIAGPRLGQFLLDLFVSLFSLLQCQSPTARVIVVHLDSVNRAERWILKDLIINLNSNRGKYNSTVLHNVNIFYFCLILYHPSINIYSFDSLFHSIMQVYTNKKHIQNLP